jgi:hypothetical protein
MMMIKGMVITVGAAILMVILIFIMGNLGCFKAMGDAFSWSDENRDLLASIITDIFWFCVVVAVIGILSIVTMWITEKLNRR